MSDTLRGYIAHPFDTRERIKAWQESVEARIDIDLVNPFYDITRKDIDEIDAGRAERYEKLIASDVVSRDIEEIAKCDFMVAFVTGDVSYGTIMEMVYAGTHGVPVYLVCTNGHEEHPWLKYHAEKVFTDVKDFEEFIWNEVPMRVEAL